MSDASGDHVRVHTVRGSLPAELAVVLLTRTVDSAISQTTEVTCGMLGLPETSVEMRAVSRRWWVRLMHPMPTTTYRMLVFTWYGPSAETPMERYFPASRSAT